MSFLAVENLTVHLGAFALKNVSFELARGDYLGVLGPSGAGKSVLLNSVTGFHSTSGGRILLDGREITGLPPERRGIGIVYQDYALFPHLSVYENIAFGLRAGKDTGGIAPRIREISGTLGLSGLLDKKPAALSGGEMQRTALARALVVRPGLLLLDEPFSALDPPTRRELRRLVRELTEPAGITVIHVAHDLDDAWALAGRALLLENGAVQSEGILAEVFSPPAPRFLRSAEGVKVVTGAVEERREGVTIVNVGGIRLATSDPAEKGEKARLILRPKDVTLHTEKPVGASARNLLDCSVSDIHNLDGTALIGLKCGPIEFNALLTKDAARDVGLPHRSRIFASIKAVHLNIA